MTAGDFSDIQPPPAAPDEAWRERQLAIQRALGRARKAQG